MTTKTTNVPTNAQPETSTGQPLAGYQAVSGSSTTTNTPTAEVQGPYAPVQISTQLGMQPLPQSQHKETLSTPGTPGISKAAQEAEAVAKLAAYFGLKDQPLGPTMEEQVVRALASKYNVRLEEPGTEDVKKSKSRKEIVGKPNAEPLHPQTTEQQTVSTPATPNKAALAQIAAKMGIDDPGKNPLVAIAGVESGGVAGDPLTTIQGDTNAQVYLNFVKQGFNPKTGVLTKQGTQWEQSLVQAGYLDLNSNLGTPTPQAVQNAFISMLNVATNGQKTGDPNTTVAPGGGITAALVAGQNIAKQTTANAPTSEAYATVQGVASEFGVYLSPQQINDIANKFAGQITAQGSPADVENSIKDLVIQQYNPNNPNDPAGVANTMYTDIQQAALDYQIPISPEQISSMVQNGLQTASVAYPASAATDVQNKAIQQFQQQAAGLYPTLAAQIQAGQTVQNLVTPYYNVAESYTGVPASTMMAEATKAGGPPSKWGAFLQGGTNPSGSTSSAGTPQGAPPEGAGQMMTIDEWKKTLMTDPQYGFQNTQGAKDMAEQMSSAILNEFGKINTDGGSSNPFGAYNPSQALEANTS